MKNIKFQMPEVEIPEVGIPDKIKHNFDYNLNQEHEVEYCYNFLNYEWVVDGKKFIARTSWDDRDKVSVYLDYFGFNVDLLESDKFKPILRFLQRRFSRIFYLDNKGQEVQIYYR